MSNKEKVISNKEHEDKQFQGVIDSSHIPSEPYLTVPEAAEHLRVKECTIYGLKYKGKITGYKRGKMLLFKKSQLDKLIERGKF